ncbi:ATP-binding protein [Flavobacterium aquidurense]|uniref:ATP-binding protein n=1 Tax=Flavobacterium aquidurense TaxID=362413 RepID=UPI00285872A1|nr:ATP-binding protein [Flavobacterium aquidurense]MDR7372983.1 PAS domain S-box-containing protein [Flavobacterium aquidurense]
MNFKEKNDNKEIILSSDRQSFQNKEIDQKTAQLTTILNNSSFQNSEQQIAEIQNLKEQLKAKQQQLNNHVNAIDTSNASIEFDLEGNILSVNKNFLEIMGYNEDDLLGKHHRLLVDPAYSKSIAYESFWSNLKNGIYQKDEFIRLAKNGKLIWLLGSYNPILDILGKPYKILKIATDITLTKTQFLQLAVQAQEKEKRASELAIANKELAFQNEEKEKRAAELVIANKELKFQNEQKEQRAKELIIANKELAIQSKEKEKRAAELIIANKKLAAENILKEKRKVEKQKRAAELIVKNRELAYQEKRSKELTLANDELKKAQEELEAFSYSVSHDLRAPIRAINGYTQIIIEDHIDLIDDDGKNMFNAIIKNSNKMGVLIDDLLAFSKLGRKQVSAVNINMTTLVTGVINDIAIEKDENIPIFELDDLAPANGDPSLIKQVWINLISNAIKYSKYKPETRIKITSTSKNDKIIYSIKDWGAGFEMEYYDKLFGVFQRLHSQEEFSGTGIGLAIVQKIVNRHYGTVWAESKLNAGAKFYFSLPDIKH